MNLGNVMTRASSGKSGGKPAWIPHDHPGISEKWVD